MNKPFTVIALTAVVAATILVGSSRSQQATTDAAVPATNPPTETRINTTPTDYGWATTQSKYAPTDRLATTHNALTEARAGVDKVVQQLRAADSDAKKVEFTKQLETAVGAYFDEDVKVRESEISKLEERLAKLRAQLDRRSKAKAEITQLQTKVLVNDAEGLGFSDAWSTSTTTPQPSMLWQKSNTFPAK